MTMDKERNMQMKNNGFWCVSRSLKYQIRTAITSTTLMEGSTVQCCIFISYVCNVQPEGGLCHGSLLQF